jgi:hypothetical protein
VFSSFLQSVCVLGYCLAPLNVASILCHVWGNKIWKLVVVIVALLWATRGKIEIIETILFFIIVIVFVLYFYLFVYFFSVSSFYWFYGSIIT